MVALKGLIVTERPYYCNHSKTYDKVVVSGFVYFIQTSNDVEHGSVLLKNPLRLRNPLYSIKVPHILSKK